MTRLAQYDAVALIASAATRDEFAFRRIIAAWPAPHDDVMVQEKSTRA